MSTRTRSRDTTYTLPSSRERRGHYISPTFKGWAYVHGLPFKHEELAYGVAPSEVYDSKEGTIESITDTIGSHGSYNEVDHTKEVWSCPQLQCYSKHSSTYKGKPLTVESTGLSAASTSLLSWSLGLPLFGESTENLVQRATSSMQFNVQDAPINLPTFLGELRDFKSIATRAAGWLKPKTGSAALRSDFRALSRRVAKGSVLDAVKAFANADLLYQFAVKPLISDLAAMAKVGQHLNAQIDRLDSTKPVVVRGVAHDEAPKEDYTSIGGWNKSTVSASATRTCYTWALVKYDWSNYPKPNEVLLALDSLGFDQPLETAWELTPWSFLVDYFVEVDDFLKQFDGSFIDLPYTVLSDGYSVKTEHSCSVETSFDTGVNASLWANDSAPPSVGGGLEKSHYIRRIGPLNYGGIQLPKLSLPNKRQLGNIAELLVSAI